MVFSHAIILNQSRVLLRRSWAFKNMELMEIGSLQISRYSSVGSTIFIGFSSACVSLLLQARQTLRSAHLSKRSLKIRCIAASITSIFTATLRAYLDLTSVWQWEALSKNRRVM